MHDLISRQAAIEAIAKEAYRHTYIEQIIDIINTLASVQPEITLEQAIDRLHELGWMQEHDRIMTESAQPRKGKWTWVPDREDEHITRLQCSVCHMGAFDETKFCPHCGALMSEGETDD